MTDKEIYKKTLVFSIRAFLFDLLAVILLFASIVIGYILGDRLNDKGLIGLVIGLVVGIIILAVLVRFTAYRYKAGQVAMMTWAITENSLPENVVEEGKRIVKERFVTVAVYFMVTGAIKSLFNTLGKAITNVGQAVGGNAGGTVGSVISSVMQTVINYLCTCCLGWVFYRREIGAFKATCEGAVIYFKHGKTLLKNMGRIFGMGALSLVVICGGLTALFYAILKPYQAAFTEFAKVFADSEDASYLSDPKVLMIVCAFIIGLIIWGIIHSTLIYPYVLVGVLRNYLHSGMDDIPSEGSFVNILGRSRKFDRLQEKLE